MLLLPHQPIPLYRSHNAVLMTFLKKLFSPFSISFFRISMLFRVSVMSLITAVSGLGQGFALLVTVYTCGWRYGPCPKALMLYNSEGERRRSHLL